jgi:hypothetical protein
MQVNRALRSDARVHELSLYDFLERDTQGSSRVSERVLRYLAGERDGVVLG